jgi:hypothetical protein
VPTHYVGKIGVTFCFKRVDPNGRDDTGRAPGRIDFRGHFTSFWPTLWWRKILELLD